MWLVQNGALLELPDDAPVPPGSLRVELPVDFFAQPEAYRVEATGIVRRPRQEVAALREQRENTRLTKDELARLKQAVAEGRL